MLHPETGIHFGREVDDLRNQLAALREENARLRSYIRPDQIEEAETVMKLIKERDEARADCVRMSMRAGELGIEVARLEGLIVALSEDERGLVTGEVHAEADRIRAALRGGGE